METKISIMERIESTSPKGFAAMERIAMRSEQEILLVYRERVAIMIHDGGLRECDAIRAAYAELRKLNPGIPMPMEIVQDLNRCINQVLKSR